MKFKIESTKEQRELLAKTFNTTERNVMYALNFERNSDLAHKIRNAALKMGCEQYEIVKKKVEMIHEPVKVLDSKGNVIRVLNQ